MNYKPDSFGYAANPFFQEKILNTISIPSDVSAEDLKNLFKNALLLDRPYAETYFPFDLKNTLNDMKNDIENIIDGIIESVRSGFLGLGKKINLNELAKFDANYEKRTLWQGLLFKVQAYHWLIAHYKGIVAPHYINSIGFALLENITKDNKRLEETKIPFSLAAKLYEKISED